MKYFLGIVLIALGISLVLKTEWYLQNLGANAWAEQHIGSEGGSRLFYKLWGLVAIFFGFLLVTNMFGGFLMATIGNLFVPN